MMGRSVVGHTCIPALWEAPGAWIMRSGDRDHLAAVKPRLVKATKLKSWAWWRAPVVPVSWEAEAGEWGEPGR